MNKLYKQQYRIKSARLKGYDYSLPRHYFVTICTKGKKHYFGKVENWEMHLSEMGKIAKNFWLEIPGHFPQAIRDEFVIMPNHIHGVIFINQRPKYYVETLQCNVSTCLKNKNMSYISPKYGSVATIIRSYKSITTRTVHEKFPCANFSWQSRYYDRIIRNHYELECVRKYIRENPQN